MAEITFVLTASGKATILKAPNARKLYGIRLTAVLAEHSASITNIVVAEAVGVTVEGGVIVEGDIGAVWVLGGTKGQIGHVTFRYTLSDGTIDDQTLYFDVRAK